MNIQTRGKITIQESTETKAQVLGDLDLTRKKGNLFSQRKRKLDY